jgi:uncharacterized membrane protein YjfL (UPF0719 family)
MVLAQDFTLSAPDIGLGVLAVLAYAALGLALLVAGYRVLDALTPGRLSDLICEDRNVNAATLTVAHLTAVTLVVASAALTSVGGRFGALLDMAVFGSLGLLLQAAAFRLLDRITPGDLGELVTSSEPHPATLVTGAWIIATSVVLAVAVV